MPTIGRRSRLRRYWPRATPSQRALPPAGRCGPWCTRASGRAFPSRTRGNGGSRSRESSRLSRHSSLMVAPGIRFRRLPDRPSLRTSMPYRSTDHRIRRVCRAVTPLKGTRQRAALGRQILVYRLPPHGLDGAERRSIAVRLGRSVDDRAHGPRVVRPASRYGATWSHDDTMRGSLGSVRGSGSDDIWAAGPGTVLHFDGKAWSSSISVSNRSFGPIWGTSAHDVWLAWPRLRRS